MKPFSKNKAGQVALYTIAAMALMVGSAYAGTGGTEVQDVYNWIIGAAQGYLGKTIMIAGALYGFGAGIPSQNLKAIAFGFGGAAGIYYLPNIIDNLVSATLPML